MIPVELAGADRRLVRSAVLLLRRHGSEISGVSATLRTGSGRVFRGLCVDAKAATVGMCAEYAAIGAMVTAGEYKIETMVAVTRGKKGFEVLPPCGKCRDLARSFGDPFVILQLGNSVRSPAKVRVSELMPVPWKEA